VKALEDRLVPSATMLADLNSYTNNSSPTNLTDVNGTLFFTATANDGSTELFKSNGTAAGTAELTFNGQGNGISSLVSFHNKLFFSNNNNLWTSDGTVAGTVPFVGNGDNVYTSLSTDAIVANKLYFVAFDVPNNGYNLWVSDGSNAGTHPVELNSLAVPDGNYANLTAVNGKVFFTSYNNVSGSYELWSSDGTAAGTGMVTQLGGNSPPNALTAVGSELYFQMYDSTNGQWALWKSDGSAGGTGQVADVSTSQFFNLAAFNNQLWFEAYDPTDAPDTNYALWTSNGTTAGPFKYNGGTTVFEVSGNTPLPVVLNGTMYLDGWDSTNGDSLWRTDGVAANNNTGTVQTGGATPFNTDPEFLTVNGSQVDFVARNSNDGTQYDLWTTGGTSANTAPVQTSGFARGMGPLTVSGGKVFFQAYDVDANANSPHGYELWASNGTNAGTAMVTDINTTTGGSSPNNFVAVGSEMFFDASTYAPVDGSYLWQSDGTAANTAPVQTSAGMIPTSEGLQTAVGNTLYFAAADANGYTIWKTGTGLHSAVDILAGKANPFNGQIEYLTNLNGTLYFGAYDAAHGQWALWTSDGTAAGTKVVKDVPASYSQVQNVTAVGSNLFWDSSDSNTGKWALWVYNGTTTTRVQEFSGEPTNMTAVGTSLFFTVYNSALTSPYSLWTSNGTTATQLLASTSAIQDLVSFNGQCYFAATDPVTNVWEMWASNGTVAGTGQCLEAGGQPVPVSGGNPWFTPVGNTLYFVANAMNGYMLGKTDGTAAGTVVVQAGYSGTVALNPSYLAAVNGLLVFNGYDGVHGYQLWQSDGTAAGTVIAAAIGSGSYSLSPQYMTTAGNLVFFTGYDSFHGTEPWTAIITPHVVTAGLSGSTDGVTEQYRDFVLTGTDTDSGETAAGFSWSINWGDGSTETISGQSGLTANHQYASVGNFTITVTATNLGDGVTSAPVTLVDSITQTEIQNGNLALGGLPGNNAWAVTAGTKAGAFTVTDNGKKIDSNFSPPPAAQILLYGGNGTSAVTMTDSGTTSDTFALGGGYVTWGKGTFVAEVPAAWTINASGSTGSDTFNINGAANASIQSGSGNDTFNVAGGASLTGGIDGGTGTNTLSYSKYSTSGVVVDLPLGTATGIAGGIAHIQNVTGSAKGGDILVGDANANVLSTLAGHNIVIGGSGGGDTLNSKGADILIAGVTNYDSNVAALQFILAEWKVSTSSNYATTINNIENSTTDPLNGTTVSDAGAPDLADTLNGNGLANSDWFFAHTGGGTNPNDVLTGQGTGDVVTGI
jgi:ELWxxDGT repeat protein